MEQRRAHELRLPNVGVDSADVSVQRPVEQSVSMPTGSQAERPWPPNLSLPNVAEEERVVIRGVRSRGGRSSMRGGCSDLGSREVVDEEEQSAARLKLAAAFQSLVSEPPREILSTNQDIVTVPETCLPLHDDPLLSQASFDCDVLSVSSQDGQHMPDTLEMFALPCVSLSLTSVNLSGDLFAEGECFETAQAEVERKPVRMQDPISVMMEDGTVEHFASLEEFVSRRSRVTTTETGAQTESVKSVEQCDAEVQASVSSDVVAVQTDPTTREIHEPGLVDVEDWSASMPVKWGGESPGEIPLPPLISRMVSLPEVVALQNRTPPRDVRQQENLMLEVTLEGEELFVYDIDQDMEDALLAEAPEPPRLTATQEFVSGSAGGGDGRARCEFGVEAKGSGGLGAEGEGHESPDGTATVSLSIGDNDDEEDAHPIFISDDDDDFEEARDCFGER